MLNLAPEAGGGAPQHGAGGAGGASAAAAVAPVAAVSETPEQQAAAAAAAAAAARAAQEAAAAAALSGAALSEPDAPEGAVMCTAWDASGTLFACGTTACKTHVWSVKEAALRSKAPGALAPAAIRGAPTAGGHLHDVTSRARFRARAPFCSPRRATARPRSGSAGFGRKSVGTFETPKKKSSGGAKNVWRLRSVLSTPADAEALRRPRRARRGPVVYAVEQAVWSRDDALVVAAMSDFTLRAWDAASGALLHTMRLHTNKVHVLQCHPFDPRVCVSAGHDGRVAVWDVSRGRCVRHYDGGEFETLVLDGSWSPCGSRIVVSDEKGQWCLFGTGCGGA